MGAAWTWAPVAGPGWARWIDCMGLSRPAACMRAWHACHAIMVEAGGARPTGRGSIGPARVCACGLAAAAHARGPPPINQSRARAPAPPGVPEVPPVLTPRCTLFARKFVREVSERLLGLVEGDDGLRLLDPAQPTCKR